MKALLRRLLLSISKSLQRQDAMRSRAWPSREDLSDCKTSQRCCKDLEILNTVYYNEDPSDDDDSSEECDHRNEGNYLNQIIRIHFI